MTVYTTQAAQEAFSVPEVASTLPAQVEVPHVVAMAIPGGPELLIILAIGILLFGANKIPKLARSSGEAIGEFKKGREELEQELNEADTSNNE